MIIVGLVFFSWLITGYLIARYGLGMSELVTLLPVALGTGSVLHFFLLNILLHFFPVLIAAWLVLALLWVIGMLSWYLRRQRVTPTCLSVSRFQALGLLIFWFVIAGVVLKASSTNISADEEDHSPRASVIASVGLPARFAMPSYANPNNCNFYHYAENAMAGVLSRQSGMVRLLDVVWLRTAYNTTATLGLCFSLLWLLLGRRTILWPVVGAVLFMWVGPGQWYANPMKIVSFDYFSAETLPFPYTTGLMTSAINYMATPNPIGFWVVALLAYLAMLQLEGQSWFMYVSIGMLAATSAVFYTTGSILVFIPIGLWLLLRVWQQRSRRALTHLILYSATGIIMLSIQGGVVTDTIFCPPFGEAYADSAVVQENASLFEFRPRLPAYSLERSSIPPAQLYDINDWERILTEWGLALPLSVFVTVYLVWTRQTHAAVIALACFGSVMWTFIMVSEVVPFDHYRLASLPLWMLTSLSVLPLYQLSLRPVWRWAVLAGASILFIMLTATDGANTFWRLTQPRTQSKVMNPLDEQVRQIWFGKLDPYTERVWGLSLADASPIAVARTQTAFGTFANLPAHFNLADAEKQIFERWQQSHFLPEIVREAGYQYLYLDESYAHQVGWLGQLNLSNPAYYQLIANYEQGAETRRLYRVVEGVCPSDKGSRLGLSPQAANAYRDYSFPVQGVIFDPSSEITAFKLDEILPVVGRYANGWHCQNLATDSIFMLLRILEQRQFEADLDLTPTQAEALTAWRTSRRPADLQASGVKYLTFNAEWFSFLSESEKAQLQADYTLVYTWTLPFNPNIPVYWLYQVN